MGLGLPITATIAMTGWVNDERFAVPWAEEACYSYGAKGPMARSGFHLRATRCNQLAQGRLGNSTVNVRLQRQRICCSSSFKAHLSRLQPAGGAPQFPRCLIAATCR